MKTRQICFEAYRNDSRVAFISRKFNHYAGIFRKSNTWYTVNEAGQITGAEKIKWCRGSPRGTHFYYTLVQCCKSSGRAGPDESVKFVFSQCDRP